MIKILKYNTAHFLLYSDKLILYGNSISIINKDLSLIYNKDLSVWYATIFCDNLLFQNENGKEINCLNLKSFTIASWNIKAFLFINEYANNALFFLDESKNIVSVDRDLKIEKSSIKGRFPKKIISSFFYRILGNKLLKIGIEDNHVEWELNFNELLNTEESGIYSEILFCDDKVFFFLKNSNDILESFVVDINTGNVLHRTNKLVGWLKLYNEKIYMQYNQKR